MVSEDALNLGNRPRVSQVCIKELEAVCHKVDVTVTESWQNYGVAQVPDKSITLDGREDLAI